MVSMERKSRYIILWKRRRYDVAKNGRVDKIGKADTTSLQSSKECPKCSSMDIKVVDSRADMNGVVGRRRECGECGHRWITYEVSEEDLVYLIELGNNTESINEVMEMRDIIASNCNALFKTCRATLISLEKIRRRK